MRAQALRSTPALRDAAHTDVPALTRLTLTACATVARVIRTGFTWTRESVLISWSSRRRRAQPAVRLALDLHQRVLHRPLMPRLRQHPFLLQIRPALVRLQRQLKLVDPVLHLGNGEVQRVPLPAALRFRRLLRLDNGELPLLLHELALLLLRGLLQELLELLVLPEQFGDLRRNRLPVLTHLRRGQQLHNLIANRTQLFQL